MSWQLGAVSEWLPRRLGLVTGESSKPNESVKVYEIYSEGSLHHHLIFFTAA